MCGFEILRLFGQDPYLIGIRVLCTPFPKSYQRVDLETLPLERLFPVNKWSTNYISREQGLNLLRWPIKQKDSSNPWGKSKSRFVLYQFQFIVELDEIVEGLNEWISQVATEQLDRTRRVGGATRRVESRFQDFWVLELGEWKVDSASWSTQNVDFDRG